MFNVIVRGIDKVRGYLRGLSARSGGWAAGAGEQAASMYLSVLQANCPMTTGVTRDRIRIESVESDETHYKAILSMPSYIFIVPGTVIRPKHAKALVFYWERVGKVVFFTYVTHPGVGGGPGWVYRSLAEAGHQLPAIIRPTVTMLFSPA